MVGPELRGANIGLQMIMANREKTMCQSKIVCTLGPACWDVDKLEELMDAGLSVARFNFSHGDHAGHKAALDRLRTAAANKKKHVAVMLDTKGPEIRTGFFADGAKKDSCHQRRDLDPDYRLFFQREQSKACVLLRFALHVRRSWTTGPRSRWKPCPHRLVC